MRRPSEESGEQLWDAVKDAYPGGRDATNFGKWLDGVASGPGQRPSARSGVNGVISILGGLIDWAVDVERCAPDLQPRFEGATFWLGTGSDALGLALEPRHARMFRTEATHVDPEIVFQRIDRAPAAMLDAAAYAKWGARWDDAVRELLAGRPTPPVGNANGVVNYLPFSVENPPGLEGPWTQVRSVVIGERVAVADAIGAQPLLDAAAEIARGDR